MEILTHRGLDPARENFFMESSFEAFENHLKRGFGIEFDLQFTKDYGIAISHDRNLGRLTEGQDKRNIDELTMAEIAAARFDACRLANFPMLIKLHESYPKALYGVHLKSYWQKPKYIDILIDGLQNVFSYENFFIFDIKILSAAYIKKKNKHIQLAPSVAHAFDKSRFNAAVGGTLITVEEAIANKKFFDWAWMDEWDRDDEKGKKALYTKGYTDMLRQENFKIAFVSPELHASSPGLVGGYTHPDAVDGRRLAKRLSEIIQLRPDAVCTDYPDILKKLTRV